MTSKQNCASFNAGKFEPTCKTALPTSIIKTLNLGIPVKRKVGLFLQSPEIKWLSNID